MPQMTYNLTGDRHGPEGGQTRVWEMNALYFRVIATFRRAHSLRNYYDKSELLPF